MRLNDADYEALRGCTPEELVEALVPDDWTIEPSARGGGTRYKDGKGNQVRIMPGSPGEDDLLHSGPYAVVSFFGGKVRIPLAGNPLLGHELDG